MIGVNIDVGLETKNTGMYMTIRVNVVGDEDSKLELHRYLMRRLDWGVIEGVFYNSKRVSDFNNYKELEEWVDEKIEEIEIEFSNFMELLEKAKNTEFEKITYRE